MSWPIVVVVVLVVGLPLAAVWWSRRAFWSKARPGRRDDLFGDVMRQHGLSPSAMGRVENAVLWGKRLEDPRERAAVVARARASLPGPSSTRWAKAVVWAAGIYLVLLVAGAVWATVEGRWGDLPWPVLLATVVVTSWNGPRRAIRRNSD